MALSRAFCNAKHRFSFFRKFPLQSCRYSTNSVGLPKRVLGAIAHINSGKTTTSEAMLYAAGALRRMGNVDTGDTALDYLPDERERGITINTAAICFNWQNHQIFLVDSPGHLDFTYEVERALKVMDGVIVLMDAVAGVQPQTETVWRQADANSLPRVVFVNKMDRDGADFPATVRSLTSYFSATPAVVQLPIFREQSNAFCGVYDLMDRFASDDPPQGKPQFQLQGSVRYEDLTPLQQHQVAKAVDILVETLADVNDNIMKLWMESEQIPRSLMLSALRDACISGALIPVICGSSLKGIGVEPLLDSVIKYLPSPLERSPVAAKSPDGQEVSVPASKASSFLAYAFKITHDKHRGRLVHLRSFSGCLDQARTPFLNTTKGKKEMPTRLLRVLADKYVEIDRIDTGDIFAAVGMKYTETGDTVVLQQTPKSSRVVMSGVATPPAVFSVALEVDSSSEERVLKTALRQLVQEDCSLESKIDEETGETLLSGMGELHLEVAVDRMSRALNFPIRMSKPRVAYRETVTDSVQHTERYDATIGTTRFRAAITVYVEPLVLVESKYENEVLISNEAFNGEERQAIRDGVDAALGRGPLLSCPVVNVRVSVQPANGSDSDTGFEIAALRACSNKAVRDAVTQCQPKLLEPVMRVECLVPENMAGDVISEISHPVRRRGTVQEVSVVSDHSENPEKKMSSVTAIVPLEGMIGWATRMRSLTRGRCDFNSRFDSYRFVDDATEDKIISPPYSRR